MRKFYLLLLLITGLLNQALAAREGLIMIPASEQTDVRLTVYNNNLAVIRDTRNSPGSYSGKKGQIGFEDISSMVLPETCTLEGVQAVEQNFNYDLLNTQALLARNVGREVTLLKKIN